MGLALDRHEARTTGLEMIQAEELERTHDGFCGGADWMQIIPLDLLESEDEAAIGKAVLAAWERDKEEAL